MSVVRKAAFTVLTAAVDAGAPRPLAAEVATPTDLAGEVRVDAVLKLALERNPELAEEKARVASSRARTRQAGRLPDLQLKYEQWGVPLRRPIALRESNALMFGLSQTFPAPGTLRVRTRLAQEESAGAAASQETRRLDLRAQVRRAFADYYRADRETKLHRDHVELTARLVELARSSYRSGKRNQQDVLRMSLELSRLHRDLAHIEQERVSAQALLNALMNRPIEAPLGPPAEIDPQTLVASGGLEGSTYERLPELGAARASLRRSEAALDLARREGHWPSLTVGADYMYMPLMEDPHEDLLPQARRNFQAAYATYAAGQGDAIALIDGLRSLLEVSLGRVRSLVHLANTAADLARATGDKENAK
jgi:outer membrane protein, heavy metal efflux system